MTIEISETGIEMRVGQPPAGQPVAGQGGEPPAAASGSVTPAQRESIVQACVRRVLAALRIGQAR